MYRVDRKIGFLRLVRPYQWFGENRHTWPMDQCANYCRRRASQRPAYGYTSTSGPSNCGTYMYWKNGQCFDARNK